MKSRHKLLYWSHLSVGCWPIPAPLISPRRPTEPQHFRAMPRSGNVLEESPVAIIGNFNELIRVAGPKEAPQPFGRLSYSVTRQINVCYWPKADVDSVYEVVAVRASKGFC